MVLPFPSGGLVGSLQSHPTRLKKLVARVRARLILKLTNPSTPGVLAEPDNNPADTIPEP